ncbi:hypothetical protein U1Q18_037129 [Sarracenia purpurea var. burkii]
MVADRGCRSWLEGCRLDIWIFSSLLGCRLLSWFAGFSRFSKADINLRAPTTTHRQGLIGNLLSSGRTGYRVYESKKIVQKGGALGVGGVAEEKVVYNNWNAKILWSSLATNDHDTKAMPDPCRNPPPFAAAGGGNADGCLDEGVVEGVVGRPPPPFATDDGCGAVDFLDRNGEMDARRDLEVEDISLEKSRERVGWRSHDCHGFAAFGPSKRSFYFPLVL